VRNLERAGVAASMEKSFRFICEYPGNVVARIATAAAIQSMTRPTRLARGSSQDSPGAHAALVGR